MANIEDGLPDLLIAQGAFGCGHPGRKDTVVNDPLELTIAIALHLGGSERRYRRRHGGRKGHACILAVAPVALHAVVAEHVLAGIDILGTRGEGVLVLLAADSDVVLHPVHRGRLGLTRRLGAAAGKRDRRDARQESAKMGSLRFHQLTTCTTKVMRPCPAPQNRPHLPWKSPTVFGVIVTSVVWPLVMAAFTCKPSITRL